MQLALGIKKSLTEFYLNAGYGNLGLMKKT